MIRTFSIAVIFAAAMALMTPALAHKSRGSHHRAGEHASPSHHAHSAHRMAAVHEHHRGRPQRKPIRQASHAQPHHEHERRHYAGGSVDWHADAGCLVGPLRRIVRELASMFGTITVNSTCRSHARNRAVGGAGHSYHLKGEAVDFRVHGNVSSVYSSLRHNGEVGGLKHYGGGLFHIDVGPRRSW